MLIDVNINILLPSKVKNIFVRLLTFVLWNIYLWSHILYFRELISTELLKRPQEYFKKVCSWNMLNTNNLMF